MSLFQNNYFKRVIYLVVPKNYLRGCLAHVNRLGLAWIGIPIPRLDQENWVGMRMSIWFLGFGLESDWNLAFVPRIPNSRCSFNTSLSFFTQFSILERSPLTLNTVGPSAISVSPFSSISHGRRSICSLYSFSVDEVWWPFFVYSTVFVCFLLPNPLFLYATWFSMDLTILRLWSVDPSFPWNFFTVDLRLSLRGAKK